jgi:hypothetical protein
MPFHSIQPGLPIPGYRRELDHQFFTPLNFTGVMFCYGAKLLALCPAPPPGGPSSCTYVRE